MNFDATVCVPAWAVIVLAVCSALQTCLGLYKFALERRLERKQKEFEAWRIRSCMR